MHKTFVLLIFALASVCLAPKTSAQQQGSRESCASGSLNQAPATGWGTESTCGCDGLRGGALASGDRVGFLWSQGKGTVALKLLYKNNIGVSLYMTAVRPNGQAYVSVNGTGLTESIVLPTVPGFTWTGQYVAACYPPEPPAPYQFVRARCTCFNNVGASMKALCLRTGDTVALDVEQACLSFCAPRCRTCNLDNVGYTVHLPRPA